MTPLEVHTFSLELAGILHIQNGGSLIVKSKLVAATIGTECHRFGIDWAWSNIRELW